MTLNVFTLALDAQPWISNIFVQLNRLTIPWKWVVVEGVALPKHCTSWMTGIAPRLSIDSTHELLRDLSEHPRITHLYRTQWDGKVTMCNTALSEFREPGVLLEADSDELWTAEQMERMVQMFQGDPSLGAARFKCRYFLGPNIIAQGENCYGSNPGEWLRAWRFQSGMQFQRHEPPTMPVHGRIAEKEETERLGLVFEHYAYALRKTCHEKSKLYTKQYAHAVSGWEQLQKQKSGKLKTYFPWVDERARFRAIF